MTRGFTAIGTGGDDFVQAMVVAVESVLQQPIPEVCSISGPLQNIDYQELCPLQIRVFSSFRPLPIYQSI